VDLLPADDPEVLALDLEARNVRAAELAYRSDPPLAEDLQRSGWFPERVAAAREGRAIPSEGRSQGRPIVKVAPEPGSLQVQVSAWSGFQGLLADVDRRRQELLEARRPEVMAHLADEEARLRERVLATPVRDLNKLVDEADELLRLATVARGQVPRTIRTASGLAPASYRESTDAIELCDAARGAWSLLGPLPSGEAVSIVTSSYGVQRDLTPSPKVQDRDGARHYGTTRSG
jgi:hypothetical protein